MVMSDALNFQKVYDKFKEQEMPLKVAYKLSKLGAILASDIQFYQEELNKILDEYAEKDKAGNYKQTEDGSGIRIKKEGREECHRKLGELQNLEIEETGISFTLEEVEMLKVSPKDMDGLMPFIKE